MFTAALFPTSQAGSNQDVRQQVGGETVLPQDNAIRFSNLKNELLSQEKTWRNLKCTLLSERISTVWLQWYHTGKAKTREAVKRSGVVSGSGGGGEKWAEHREFLEKLPVRFCYGGHRTLCICQNPLNYTIQREKPNVNDAL